jgi:hypothetical protein
MMAEDFIAHLVAQIRAAAPDLPADRVESIAVGIQRDWGGATVYIKKAPAAGKASRLGSALAAGVPLSQAFADVGVCRSHGYALIGRRWRR